MGIFQKLFRKKPAASHASDGDTSMIEVFDKYGRAMEIPRAEWRTKVLPGQIQEQWNDPERLSSVITHALRDGFSQDVLAATDRLLEIDSDKKRAVVIKMVTLLDLKRHHDAKQLGEFATKEYGPDGYILTNLAKAQAGLGENVLSEATLWGALELDPNQDNGLLWYASLQREKGGIEAEYQAFEQMSSIPGSWRPQLWLARMALQDKDIAKALKWYQYILETHIPLSHDAFMQMSGDLGMNGYLNELLALCAPHFDIDMHGLPGGNNLLKGYIDTKRAEEARILLERLYQRQRPDWRDNLVYWDGEIDKLDRVEGPLRTSSEKPVLTLLMSNDCPVWAAEDSPLKSLVPDRPSKAKTVAFVCGSAEPSPVQGDEIHVSKTETRGRFTRGLAAWLTEQALLRTDVHTTFLVPWIETGGFVLSGARWDTSIVEHFDVIPDWLVFHHLDANQTPWTVEVSLQRPEADHPAFSAKYGVDPNGPEEVIRKIWDDLSRALIKNGATNTSRPPDWCPSDNAFPLFSYLGVSEQALAVGCAGLGGNATPFLYAERSINESMLDLAVRNLNSPLPILLLAATLIRQQSRVPSIATEYIGKAKDLLKEARIHPTVRDFLNAVICSLESNAPIS